MNKNLWLLALCQGFYLTNSIVFIAVNGLVGLELAPFGWMATLPVMGYVVGGALSTALVARSQRQWGRKRAFQIGLAVAAASAALCAWAAFSANFWLLCTATVVAGYYVANSSLYRFAAAELAATAYREKAVSLVLAGGLLGAVIGPNLANATRTLFPVPFAGCYIALIGVALLSMLCMNAIRFEAQPVVLDAAGQPARGRPLAELMRQPALVVAILGAALGYGVMNLLMTATPLAMKICSFDFNATAQVLQWHVIGMFAPGFVTGHLIKRFGVLSIMGAGVLLNAGCVAIALAGVALQHFGIALFLLGMGWNFLFTGATTLAMTAYRPEEKDRAQAIVNFCVFATLALSSFSSGVLVTTQGWTLLNAGSLAPIAVTGMALAWLAAKRRVIA
ncbi:MFS transporter [Verminephrobacter eiseniae]|uniref:MFS transporter n=1 Tax=Verminephrobacter eiseniae TaxID=364317 RepID=UPI002238CFBE|nr:MFS transporter [Verminephrobacter eiseniae]MCW5236591.1 MFS transporter [Verminephrobacter eiseniae]